jgi:hypothetical protein
MPKRNVDQGEVGAKLGQRERAKPSPRILQKIKGMGLSLPTISTGGNQRTT